jgi:hypothetical protein
LSPMLGVFEFIMSMAMALVSELITYKRACAYLCGRDSSSLMKFWIINCMIWPWFCKYEATY